MMKIAVIADVHGNALALNAVLGDIARLSPDLIVNLGDLVCGPFDPAAAADRQMALNCPTLRGNHDRWVANGPTSRTDLLTRTLLTRSHLEWLAALPAALSLLDGEVFACHGSPAGGDTEYLLDTVTGGALALAKETDIVRRLAGAGRARVLLCAHSHLPRIVIAGGILVINPGSVGWAAYHDPDPVPHNVEAGSPHARYSVLTYGADGWNAELRAVRYDWEAAARQAEAHGRADIAFAVRTGRVAPR